MPTVRLLLIFITSYLFIYTKLDDSIPCLRHISWTDQSYFLMTWYLYNRPIRKITPNESRYKYVIRVRTHVYTYSPQTNMQSKEYIFTKWAALMLIWLRAFFRDTRNSTKCEEFLSAITNELRGMCTQYMYETRCI
jgi:hypothetical protein